MYCMLRTGFSFSEKKAWLPASDKSHDMHQLCMREMQVPPQCVSYTSSPLAGVGGIAASLCLTHNAYSVDDACRPCITLQTSVQEVLEKNMSDR